MSDPNIDPAMFSLNICGREAQLILVTPATTGGGVLFQAGVLFSSENAKGTTFSKVNAENINTNLTLF